jgi:hypothetical protein
MTLTLSLSLMRQKHWSRGIVVGPYRMYNAYARFIHHLYEFMAGALARDVHDTRIAKKPEEVRKMTEQFITGHAARILRNKRQSIQNVEMPGWEDALATLPSSVPPEFSMHFREHRNVMSGHVKYERAGLKLIDFYDQYHFYMFLLYRDAYSWWGLKGKELPDLEEITAFSVLVKEKSKPDINQQLAVAVNDSLDI